MYLKVLLGRVNYKNNVYKVGDLFECKKEIGIKLVNSKLCTEVPEDLFKVLNKNDFKSYVEDVPIKKDTKTIDDLRDELNGK